MKIWTCTLSLLIVIHSGSAQSISVDSGDIRYESLELIVEATVTGVERSANVFEYDETFRSDPIILAPGEVANVLNVPWVQGYNGINPTGRGNVEATYPSGLKLNYGAGKYIVGPAEIVAVIRFTGSSGDGAPREVNYSTIASIGIFSPAQGEVPFQTSNAVVIPEDASGPVEIIMESSTDLINWTMANPGNYGSSTEKRFFRLRAVQR
jgi:hypothetical protein